MKGERMKVTSVTATIKYSQDTGKGAWKAVEIGAEGTVEGGETWADAQTRLYQDLTGQLRALWGSGSPASVNGSHPDTTEHYCHEHRAEFKRYTRGNAVWYAHKQADGRWCREP